MIRRILPIEVVKELPGEGAVLPPPELWHAERIPPGIRVVLDRVWSQVWFPPSPVRLSLLEDVFVAGEGLVLTAGLEVIAESVTQHAEYEVSEARAAVIAGLAGGSIPRLRGETVLCRKRGAENYGHWLVEMLPRAWLAGQLWPRPVRMMVQHVGPNLQGVMHHTLARLGIGDAGVMVAGREPVRVDRLILVDGLTEHGVAMSPLVVECLQMVTARIPAKGPDRLLVMRGADATRRFADEAVVVAQGARAGFGVLDPSTLPFTAQVAAFKAARTVVGVMGAGMSNLAFCEEGAVAHVLAPAVMPDTFYFLLASLRGLRVEEVRCEGVGVQRDSEWPWNAPLQLDQADRDRVFSRDGPNRRLQRPFDAGYYRTQAPGLPPDADVVTHYMETGWRQGHNPSAAFDTARYLAANPDVAAAGINPLVHYLRHGRAEGRTAFPVAPLSGTG
jgi:capsular polysaccharide biosynthesis protein